MNHAQDHTDYAAFIGIDWADQKHDVCLLAAGGGATVEHTVIEQTPEALAQWVLQWRQRFDSRPIAVCIELTRGPIIHHLMQYEFIVLMPIAPLRLKEYRSAMRCSGAKDDPTDAALILDYLLKHREHLRPWRPDDAQTRRLGLLCEHRREFVDDRTRLSNKLTETLKGYFPQAIAWLNRDLSTALAADFLLKWPTLEAFKRAKPNTIRNFFYAHRSRRVDQIQDVIKMRGQAQPLTHDPALTQALSMKVTMLAQQLKDLARAIKAYDKRIAQLFAGHPDAFIFDALPGAGRALAPRLLTALGTDRGRFPDAASLQSFSGVAPVTRRSGKSCVVHRRWACPTFLLQTFHEFANASIRKSQWARAYYQQQRDKGNGHHAAVRALAFKWIRIIIRCWQTRTPYNEAKYLQCLQQRQSPLATRA